MSAISRVALTLFLLPVSAPLWAAPPEEAARSLAADGWASVEGGTEGGARAGVANVFHVRDIEALRKAFTVERGEPRIVVVEGVIDAAGGKPFADKADQAARTLVRVPSNTTLIGADKGAGFVNAALLLKKVDNVIVRNLTIQNPWDEFPVWDPNDGPSGHWNSEYDGMTIDQSTHVWVDQVTFTDRPRTDDQNGMANGQEVQHHDGALDMKNASDFITVSHSIFAEHDKNNLIGHSDKNSKDGGHLRVTFHDNLFENVVQRAPRVRYGQVHLYNNHYVGAKAAPVYAHMYSIGLGVESSVISEDNAFDIQGAGTLCDLVRSFGGTRFSDARSLLNGRTLDKTSACTVVKGRPALDAPGWQVPYAYKAMPASEVAASVKAAAGPR